MERDVDKLMQKAKSELVERREVEGKMALLKNLRWG